MNSAIPLSIMKRKKTTTSPWLLMTKMESPENSPDQDRYQRISKTLSNDKGLPRVQCVKITLWSCHSAILIIGVQGRAVLYTICAVPRWRQLFILSVQNQVTSVYTWVSYLQPLKKQISEASSPSGLSLVLNCQKGKDLDVRADPGHSMKSVFRTAKLT